MDITDRISRLLQESRPSRREQELLKRVLLGMEEENFDDPEKFYRYIERQTEDFLEELYAVLENFRGADRDKLTSLKPRDYIALHNAAVS